MPFEPAGLVPALRDAAGALVLLVIGAYAAVVGLAAAIRTSRELNLATHTIARSLMLHAGFRAVHIERTTDTGADLDRYVVTGVGGRSSWYAPAKASSAPPRRSSSSAGFVSTASSIQTTRSALSTLTAHRHSIRWTPSRTVSPTSTRTGIPDDHVCHAGVTPMP